MELSQFGLDKETLKGEVRARIISAFDAPGCTAAGGRNASTRGPGAQQRFKALRRAALLVGQQPPQPPTLRAAIGAVLIRLIRRALFWQSAQITSFQVGATAELEEQAHALEQQQLVVKEQAQALEQQQVVVKEQVQALDQLRLAVTQQARALEEQKHELERRAQSLKDTAAALEEIRADLSHARAEMEENRARTSRGESQLFTLRSQFAVQDRLLSDLGEEARRRLPEPMNEGELKRVVSEGEHALDALYVNFEDEFRGAREEILRRLKVYMPLIEERGLGQPEMPIVDLGCGRGEWLELLRDRGLEAHGVDRNRIMVAQCRELGLDAEEGDLFAYLRSLRTSSVGMVTLFHVLEHLPTDGVIEIFDHCVRVLKPGGAALVETPNPENILVGAHTFYTDFTHRNPLPSLSLRFLAESRGLCQAEIWNLNPYPDASKVPELSETDRRFNSLFYGPRDYALIGFKA